MCSSVSGLVDLEIYECSLDSQCTLCGVVEEVFRAKWVVTECSANERSEHVKFVHTGRVTLGHDAHICDVVVIGSEICIIFCFPLALLMSLM